MKTYCIIVLLLWSIILIRGVKTENLKSNIQCIKPSVKVKQVVKNDGFHKDVELNINFLDDKIILENNCKLSIKVYATNGFFINPDEMLELIRKKKISAIVDKTVDIEAPAHESIAHAAHIFIDPSKNNQINYGIHLRYHRAQILGGYVKIPLKRPLLLIQCERSAICGDDIIAPCDEIEEKPCNWREVLYESDFSEMELQVPVGDLDDYPLVAIISLSLGCAGTLYLLSLLNSTML